MNAKRKCMVGHDDDYGWIIAIAIAILRNCSCLCNHFLRRCFYRWFPLHQELYSCI